MFQLLQAIRKKSFWVEIGSVNKLYNMTKIVQQNIIIMSTIQYKTQSNIKVRTMYNTCIAYNTRQNTQNT